jgi:hypothetical protein
VGSGVEEERVYSGFPYGFSALVNIHACMIDGDDLFLMAFVIRAGGNASIWLFDLILSYWYMNDSDILRLVYMH